MSPDIDEALKFLEKHKPGYGYYYDDRYKPSRESIRKQLINNALNCSDEIAPGSNERTSKIRRLMHKKIEIPSENFTEEYAEIMHEIRDLVKEEYMSISGCSEREVDHFLDMNVDFNHVKKHTGMGGKVYLSVDPKIKGE